MTPVAHNLQIAPMSREAIAKVHAIERIALTRPQVDIKTEHFLHAGTYTRTIFIPKDTMLTGALMKVPTVLIIHGDVTIYTGDGAVRLSGYHVLRAAAGRKTAFATHDGTHVTMMFATDAATVEQAENEFTDEADQLMSRKET